MAASPVNNDVLNSWKEIAQYLNRGVRTVQRWELELSFPVRRPRGKQRSAVIGIRSDIDKWLHERPGGHESVRRLMQSAPGVQSQVMKLDPNLVSESRQLRSDVARLREELTSLVKALSQKSRTL